MIDITGIRETWIYHTCWLRRQVVKIIQKEIERPDFSMQSKDVGNLHGLLGILNRDLKSMSKGIVK